MATRLLGMEKGKGKWLGKLCKAVENVQRAGETVQRVAKTMQSAGKNFAKDGGMRDIHWFLQCFLH